MLGLFRLGFFFIYFIFSYFNININVGAVPNCASFSGKGGAVWINFVPASGLPTQTEKIPKHFQILI
jgi:hypothetical protein